MDLDLILVIRKCPQCGREYFMGKTGVVTGCDVCLKITRASNGFVIEPLPPPLPRESRKRRTKRT